MLPNVTVPNRVKMTAIVPAGEQQEIQYTNDILAMISPENEKVSLGKVLHIAHFLIISVKLI